jgi:hypothetical protein
MLYVAHHSNILAQVGQGKRQGRKKEVVVVVAVAAAVSTSVQILRGFYFFTFYDG